MKQLEISIFRDESVPCELERDTVSRCRTWRDAFWVGFKHSTKVHQMTEIADAIGKSKGYVSQIMKEGSRKNFNLDQIYLIEVAFGNRAITQFMGLKLDGALMNQQSNEDYRLLCVAGALPEREKPKTFIQSKLLGLAS